MQAGEEQSTQFQSEHAPSNLPCFAENDRQASPRCTVESWISLGKGRVRESRSSLCSSLAAQTRCGRQGPLKQATLTIAPHVRCTAKHGLVKVICNYAAPKSAEDDTIVVIHGSRRIAFRAGWPTFMMASEKDDRRSLSEDRIAKFSARCV